MRRLLIFVLIPAIFAAGCGRDPNQSPGNRLPPESTIPSSGQKTYLEQRQAFQTKIRHPGPSPHAWLDRGPPDGVREVLYPSAGLELKAWLQTPRTETGKPRPALVYLHGGFALTTATVKNAQLFVDAGFVVLYPSFRGENGNPGSFELMFGEVDDARAAVRWLAEQPLVDRERIYVFGQWEGGGVASLLSLLNDVPVQHSAGVGGLFNANNFIAWRHVIPFDRSRVEEYEMRLLLGHVAEMKHRHYAYLGSEDSFTESKNRAKAEIAGKESLLEIVPIPGDHNSSLPFAVEAYLKRIQDETALENDE
jgi:acetyl esterase/lipase